MAERLGNLDFGKNTVKFISDCGIGEFYEAFKSGIVEFRSPSFKADITDNGVIKRITIKHDGVEGVRRLDVDYDSREKAVKEAFFKAGTNNNTDINEELKKFVRNVSLCVRPKVLEIPSSVSKAGWWSFEFQQLQDRINEHKQRGIVNECEGSLVVYSDYKNSSGEDEKLINIRMITLSKPTYEGTDARYFLNKYFSKNLRFL